MEADTEAPRNLRLEIWLFVSLKLFMFIVIFEIHVLHVHKYVYVYIYKYIYRYENTTLFSTFPLSISLRVPVHPGGEWAIVLAGFSRIG